jgi:hypothetical protein
MFALQARREIMPETALGMSMLWYATGLAVVLVFTIARWFGGDDVTLGDVIPGLMLAMAGPLWFAFLLIYVIAEHVVPAVANLCDRVIIPGRRGSP